MDHVSLVKSSTHCSFGRSAKIVQGPSYRTGDNHADHLENIISDFTALTSRSAAVSIDETDVYLLPYEDKEAGASLAALAHTVRNVFTALSDADPAGEACMRQQIDAPAWIFKFAGYGFYPIATAPCYPADSSRYNGGTPYTYLMFLPQAAFKRRHPPGTKLIPNAAREHIRREHEKHGMPYDLSISLGDFECYKIVKPVQYGAAVVRWWEQP